MGCGGSKAQTSAAAPVAAASDAQSNTNPGSAASTEVQKIDEKEQSDLKSTTVATKEISTVVEPASEKKGPPFIPSEELPKSELQEPVGAVQRTKSIAESNADFQGSMLMSLRSTIRGNEDDLAFLGDHFSTFPPRLSWKLLYDSSKDGWSSTKFHTLCDKQGPTITVVRMLNKHVFGGEYSPLFLSHFLALIILCRLHTRAVGLRREFTEGCVCP